MSAFRSTPEAGPLPGANMFITHCIHGLDLRLHPRCYLCRPDEPMVVVKSAAALAASDASGQTWRCPGCRDTTAPEGMCQRCGVFGEPLVSGIDALRAIVEIQDVELAWLRKRRTVPWWLVLGTFGIAAGALVAVVR